MPPDFRWIGPLSEIIYSLNLASTSMELHLVQLPPLLSQVAN